MEGGEGTEVVDERKNEAMKEGKGEESRGRGGRNTKRESVCE